MENKSIETSTALSAIIANNIKTFRLRMNISLNELAARSRIGKSTLSVIESRQGNPNIETLWAIATALEVPFGQLLEPQLPAIRIIRANDGMRIDTEDESVNAYLLLSRSRRGTFELFKLELQPGARRVAKAHQQGITEHIVLLQGKMLAGPINEPVALSIGDFLSFPADCQHLYENKKGGAKAIVLMEYDL